MAKKALLIYLETSERKALETEATSSGLRISEIVRRAVKAYTFVSQKSAQATVAGVNDGAQVTLHATQLTKVVNRTNGNGPEKWRGHEETRFKLEK